MTKPTDFNVGTHRLSYRDNGGQGQVVLFLSGWGFGSPFGEIACRELAAQGYRTITIDVPGTGAQREASSFVLISHLARNIAELLRSKNLAEVNVVGHAFGSMIAQELALSHDDVLGKLVLISPHCGFGEMRLPLAQAMNVMNRLMSGAITSWTQLFTPAQLDQVKTTLGVAYAELDEVARSSALSGQLWAAGRWTSLGRLNQVYQPVLILHGEQDVLNDGSQLPLLDAQLPAVTVEKFAGGHFFFLEEQTKVTARLDQFFNGK